MISKQLPNYFYCFFCLHFPILHPSHCFFIHVTYSYRMILKNTQEFSRLVKLLKNHFFIYIFVPLERPNCVDSVSIIDLYQGLEVEQLY